MGVSILFILLFIISIKITIMKKKIKMTPKRKELINNLSQTILKESKKANGVNKQLIDKLQNILDKVKP